MRPLAAGHAQLDPHTARGKPSQRLAEHGKALAQRIAASEEDAQRCAPGAAMGSSALTVATGARRGPAAGPSAGIASTTVRSWGTARATPEACTMTALPARCNSAK